MAIKNVEIAKRLNISPAAVSLARNNKPGVSEETRARVKEVLSAFGGVWPYELYAPDNGIILVIHKTHGQVIKNTPFFQNMMESIQHLVAKQSYSLYTLNYASQYNLQEHLDMIHNSPMQGILLVASEMNEEDFQPYKALNKAIVVIDAHFPNEDVEVVGIDNEFLIRQAIRYAVEMGHTNIGFLASYIFTYNFEDRFNAYRKVMAEYNLPVQEKNIFYLHSTAEKAYIDMLGHLKDLKRSDLPTIFIAGNDLLAIGAIKALKEYGLKIPQDISMIGFDNMPITNLMEPPLTTIDISSKDLDILAVDSILGMINQNGTRSCCRKDVRGKLIIRESVKRLSPEK
ncbi:MAG: LacI family DNA-binding transcriptional regulator [Flexilinea sp.]